MNATNGTLTLSGSATLAQYEAALRSFTYTNTSDNPSTATRTVSFTVNDGSANSNTQTRDINITAVNDAPVQASIEAQPLVIRKRWRGSDYLNHRNHRLGRYAYRISSRSNHWQLCQRPRRPGVHQPKRHHWLVECHQRHLDSHRFRNTGSLPSRPAFNHLHQHQRQSIHGHSHRQLHRQRWQRKQQHTKLATSLSPQSTTRRSKRQSKVQHWATPKNAGAVAITSTIAITDVDDTNIESAVVQITGNYANGQDVLAFTNQNGITGSWNTTNGTLTLTGSATLAQYEAALRSITYTNTSDNPSTATRTVSFTVNDGSANSNTQTRDINITGVNDAPVLDHAGTMTLTAITEDQTNGAGQTVASIIASAGGDRITDVDSGAIEGIAIHLT